jgi:hypothetical protein
VDDIALTLVSVPNPVPSAGHFNRALPGIFSQALKDLTPKQVSQLAKVVKEEFGSEKTEL